MRKIIRETVLEYKPLCTYEEFRFDAFRTLKVDSRIETRTRDQNAIYRSLSLQREDASCTGASIE